jgi:hypothetical protein
MNDAVGQPKLVEVKLEGLSGEETEHDRLAEGGRENGHPEVHFLAVLGPLLDVPVLRQASLGDVERHLHFDARGDRRLETHRRLHDVLQHAVIRKRTRKRFS